MVLLVSEVLGERRGWGMVEDDERVWCEWVVKMSGSIQCVNNCCNIEIWVLVWVQIITLNKPFVQPNTQGTSILGELDMNEVAVC